MTQQMNRPIPPTPKPASPIPIAKAGDNVYFKLFVYGNSGIGKTRFIGTAESDERVFPALVLDVEKGTSSLKGTGVDVAKIDTILQLNQMHEWLLKDNYYKLVAIDSITAVHQFILMDLLNNPILKKDKKAYMEDALEQQDYAKAMNKLNTIIRAFIALDKHVIITSLVKEELDAREGLIRKPGLAGQLSETIGQYVDCLGYLTIGQDGVRTLLTQPTKGIRAKFRVPTSIVAPATIPEPTITKLLDIKEGKK